MFAIKLLSLSSIQFSSGRLWPPSLAPIQLYKSLIPSIKMKINRMLGRSKATEAEIPKNKFSQKKKSWRKAVHSEEEEEDDGSEGLSDISSSTDGEMGDYLDSLDERSEDHQLFEKRLRNKHSRACNAMSVRNVRSIIFLCSLFPLFANFNLNLFYHYSRTGWLV